MATYYLLAAGCLLFCLTSTQSYAQEQHPHLFTSTYLNELSKDYSLLQHPTGHSPTRYNVSADDAPNSPNNNVRAIATDGPEIFIGGDFTRVGNTPASYIAYFDGTSWQGLGNIVQGLSGPVHAIQIDGDNVYVGGSFTYAGSVKAQNIAVWNRRTKSWSGLQGGVGGTINSTITSMVVDDGQLYVGGRFLAAGTTVAVNIARWDGRKWHRVGTGANDIVEALHIDGDYLYAGGEFTIAGDVPVSGIARYSLQENSWNDLGIEIDGPFARVEAIASDNTYLYIGGAFEEVNGEEVSNIFRVDKASGEWSQMYKGVYGADYRSDGAGRVEAVKTILVRGTDVFVGGTLIYVPAIRPWNQQEVLDRTDGMAKWDGESWTKYYGALQSGFLSETQYGSPITIFALTNYLNDTLLCGGDFRSIYAPSANRERLGKPYLCKFIDGQFPNGGPIPFSAGKGTSGGSSNSFASVAISAKEYAATSVQANRLEQDPLNQEGAAIQPSALPLELDCNRFADDNRNWQALGEDVPTNDGIQAVAAAGSEIYVGGAFDLLFGIETNGIAVRKNSVWQPIIDGEENGVNGFVYAITIKGPNVYVAGQFTQAGSVKANNIAVWNRVSQTWSALGSGVTTNDSQTPFISDIAIENDEIVVGGSFTIAGVSEATNIAKWTGSEWVALGSGIDGSVNALQFFKGNLYAGGSFSRAGTIASSGIAYWDGLQWNRMHGGINGYVNDLDVYLFNSTSIDSNSMLVIGGNFTVSITNKAERISDVPARNVIWWDGTAFTSYLSDHNWLTQGVYDPVRVLDGEVRSIHVQNQDMYFAGTFTSVEPGGEAGSGYNRIGRLNIRLYESWKVPIWFPIKGGLNSQANAMAFSDEGLIVGGDFTEALGQGTEADHVVLWNVNQQRWNIIANPVPYSPVRSLAYINNNLYAAGQFTEETTSLYKNSTQIVRFTHSGWRTLDGIVKGTSTALATPPGNEFVLGGTTITSDGKIAVNISRWNTNTHEWQPLTPGSGVASLQDISFVSAIAGNENIIVVGGQFDIADTMTAYNIAQWDRVTEQWSNLGEGLNGRVWSIAFDQNNDLYAAGEFSRSGTTAVSNIAHWTGSQWLPLGEGLDGPVYSIVVLNGKVYAGGKFRNAGQTEAINVAVWDPDSQTWSQLGLGLDSDFEPSVSVLTARDGHLFVGGKFEVSGPDSIVNVARWNPGGWWDRLGSGTDQQVSSIAVDPESGEVYVSGDFRNAGCKPSQYIARWLDPTLSVEQESPLFTYNFTASTQPNPFTGSTRIHLNFKDLKAQRVALTLFDESGGLVQTFPEGLANGGEYSVEIDGSTLASGAYFMHVKSEAGSGTVKLVKR